MRRAVSRGKRGGKVLTYENVGRRINNSEFVMLVAGSWVGTSIEQSAVLGDLIRTVLAAGKTVTLAIRHSGWTGWRGGEGRRMTDTEEASIRLLHEGEARQMR